MAEPWGSPPDRHFEWPFEVDGLARLVESLPHGVLVVAPDGTIAAVNRALERQFGYGREELIGRPVDDLLPQALQQVHAGLRAAFMRSPETRPMNPGRDVLARHRDGSPVPVEIRLNPFDSDRGTCVLATVIDVSVRRATEDATRLTVDAEVGFERLVAELSVGFINLDAERVDEAIREALGRIGEAVNLDRCRFHRVQPDGTLAEPVCWMRAGLAPAPAAARIDASFPWTLEAIGAGQVLSFRSVDTIPNPIDRESYRSSGVRAAVVVPLASAGQILGAVGFDALRDVRQWPPEAVHTLRVIAAVFGEALARQRIDEDLRVALTDVGRQRDRLQAENLSLRREVQARLDTGPIVGQSPALRRVLDQARQVAPMDSTVLLLGETGTGKELFASHIHQLSARRGRPMVRVNCSAIPSTLIESELFGRERGAFTGALARQVGRFELADHSTIFLDEVGELPLDVQVKLLRVLESGQIERLGSPKPIHVDVRVIAATHRHLEQRVAQGAFREDVFYRLNVFPIQLPPLRDRAEDIPHLVWRFVDEFSNAFGKRIDAIPPENIAALQRYGWPGNIRELRNVVERAMIVARGPKLTIGIPEPPSATVRRSTKLLDVEREHIRAVLENAGWRIRGPGGAADRLGLRPTTLETRMAKLGLRRPKPT